VTFVNDNRSVVKIFAAQFVEADDKCRIELTRFVEEFHYGRGIDRKRHAATDRFGVWVSGQTAFGESYDFHAIALGLLKAGDDLGQVCLEFSCG